MRILFKTLKFLIVLGFVCGIAMAAGGLWVFYTYGRNLPDYRALAAYQPPVMTRVHAGDGRLVAEYAIEKRVFVPIGAIPKRVKNAFLAAEDKHFYSHFGIDLTGIARAALTNLKNYRSGRRLVGASTITQQVAKNFLLSNELSLERKIKEAILALRIERALDKARILELYLNEIYLGRESYGVATAALNYFDKSMDELSIAEAAFLAALPKAPNNYNPTLYPRAAKERRDWVIGRMVEDGRITQQQGALAKAKPLQVRNRQATEFVRAEYFAEEVRRELAARYGENALYKGGLSVRTTLDPFLQEIAERTLRQGLEAYDRRHGYRGPLFNLSETDAGSLPADWSARLAVVEIPRGMPAHWRIAVVTGVEKERAWLGFADGRDGTLPLAEMLWARPPLEEQEVGARPTSVSDVLRVGDGVIVTPVSTRTNSDGDSIPYPSNTYALRQLPEIQGALIALNPHTGRVLAMTGGYAFAQSEFNRATQAARQAGSAFKPFVYLAGLDWGLTPSSIVLDAPFVIDQGPGLPKWRPGNYTKKFYGPSTLRLGIEKSRNLMTVRLAQAMGMERVAEYAEKFGIVDDLPETLAMSLGASETTLMRLTTGYAMLVNGGRKIKPTLIDRIQDRTGKTIFSHDGRPCPGCFGSLNEQLKVPTLPDMRPQIADPASAYQVVSMLQGVVLRGTGRRIGSLNRPLAGKTGTTNASRDTWFIGFSPDLAVGVFIGFDQPATLGAEETGSSVAAPVFKEFMREALQDSPEIPFRVPSGVNLVRVDATTGQLARAGDSNVILEAFKPGTEPKEGEPPPAATFGALPKQAKDATGGLY